MEIIKCTDLLNQRTVQISIDNNRIVSQQLHDEEQTGNIFIGPGLTDLQVNGFQGIDFNAPPFDPPDVMTVTEALIRQGVTAYFPTVITNADENIITSLKGISHACETYPLVQRCVAGIHLEGPFLSADDGARGAHNPAYIKAPDWSLFQKFQEAANGRIKIITISPHWENIIPFIKKCINAKIIVSVGHTNATPEQVMSAADAGATMSTHLGNAVPLLLPRHPNIIWEQLAADALTATFIADGFHLPDSFMKVLLKVKGERAIVISDSTMFCGMPPGMYSTHIGDEVILDGNGRLSMKSDSRLLAGSASSLLDGVRYLIQHNLATLEAAWTMASEKVNRLAGSENDDRVIFEWQEAQIKVLKVFKSGDQVYSL